MNPSEEISDYIARAADWRGQCVGRLRALILEASPGITEEWKWNSPTWSQDGLVVSVSAFKRDVRATFFNGAALEDPRGLFNASLEAKTMRSIKIREGDSVDESAFQDLVRAAVAHNAAGR